MYLSDRDLADAVQLGHLIFDPPPKEYDTTSIDLHLDSIETARIWDVEAFEKDQRDAGQELPVLRLGFNSKAFADKYHRPISTDPEKKVFRVGEQVILKPGGFFLWQTKQVVGTPEDNPRFICFIDGKSTKARVGLLVHMTAPNIHAGWWGKITLEISNLGPFTLALKPDDDIAQIVVACLTTFPAKRKQVKGVNVGQKGVGGK